MQDSYVPNLSEYKRRVNGSYTWDDRRHSAGVDCVSFVKRSANFDGVIVGYPSSIDDLDRDTLDRSPFIDHYSSVKIHDNSWKVYERNVSEDQLLNLVVPGDYVQIDGHAALIGKVTFINERNTILARITFIESTTFSNEWYVQNDQKLSEYGNDFIAIWRFKQN